MAKIESGAQPLHQDTIDLRAVVSAAVSFVQGLATQRGLRISVELILSMLAQGETFESLLDDYPGLELDDIRACLAFAHAMVAHESLDDVEVART